MITITEAEPVPEWVRRVDGFRAADLDDLPDAPPHTELIDGGLVFRGPQRLFHSRTVSALERALMAAAPDSLDVVRQMSVILGERQRPEPDIAVLDASAVGSPHDTWYPAVAVRLAVEVVSPESEIRDRERKPQLYARAGIPHFWRVEENDGKPVVYVYELDPATSTYIPTGIFHETLKLPVPFDLEIDLTTFDRR